MGILDDFIKNIKTQREQYKAEQARSVEEKAAEENAARVKAAREKAGIETSKEEKAEARHGGSVIDRMKEQRRQFEEAGKKGTPSISNPTKTLQETRPPKEAAVITRFYHTFHYIPGSPEHVWFDDTTKSVYIDDPDAFISSGGKVEVRGITGAMDQYMYDIYTSRGGPVGQARYYRQENTVISLVPDPFVKYR